MFSGRTSNKHDALINEDARTSSRAPIIVCPGLALRRLVSLPTSTSGPKSNTMRDAKPDDQYILYRSLRFLLQSLELEVSWSEQDAETKYDGARNRIYRLRSGARDL